MTAATLTETIGQNITEINTGLSHRDRAVLRAVAQGRCQMAGDCGTSLLIDGVCYCDQFAGLRLTNAGLIEGAGAAPGTARLTATGSALLATF